MPFSFDMEIEVDENGAMLGKVEPNAGSEADMNLVFDFLACQSQQRSSL